MPIQPSRRQHHLHTMQTTLKSSGGIASVHNGNPDGCTRPSHMAGQKELSSKASYFGLGHGPDGGRDRPRQLRTCRGTRPAHTESQILQPTSISQSGLHTCSKPICAYLWNSHTHSFTFNCSFSQPFWLPFISIASAALLRSMPPYH